MPQDIREALRRALLRAMKRGVSLHELARRSGYDVAGVSRFVNGLRQELRLGPAQRLAKAAGCELRLVPKPQPDRRRRTRKKEARR